MMSEAELAVGIGQSLGVSALMVAITVVIHFFGLAVLIAILRPPGGSHIPERISIGLRVGAVLVAVFGLFGLHTIEIWLYAALYRYGLQVLADFETALYFSTVSFVSLGYGDVVLPKQWRLIGAIEGANGILLLGWSTAFLVSVIAKLRALDDAWLGRDRG